VARTAAAMAAGTAATAASSGWHMVGGRWRPARLPGQPKPQAQPQKDVLRQLWEAQVAVRELQNVGQLTALLDQLDNS